jgi:hypothetical protein
MLWRKGDDVADLGARAPQGFPVSLKWVMRVNAKDEGILLLLYRFEAVTLWGRNRPKPREKK